MYFGIEYRDMHTALHGIALFSTIDDAESANLMIADAQEEDDRFGTVDAEQFWFAVNEWSSEEQNLDEINYRDVYDGDDGYKYYDDDIYDEYKGVKIVNDFAYDIM